MLHHIVRLPISNKDGLSLFVFGDMQYGAEGFDSDAWEQFRDEFKATPNAWALGLGDYSDWLRPTMRGRLVAAASHDTSAQKQLDDRVRVAEDELLNKMAFLDGRVIGLHEGHHDWEYMSGIKSSQRIAAAIKAPFLGWTASTRIIAYMGHGDSRSKWSHAYTIVSTHGQANGRRTGAATTWMENNLTSFVADHYIMGHSCKQIAWVPNERHSVRRNGPAGIDITLPRCLQVGGFHRGYTDGWSSSYVERSGFAPQPLSWGVIRFSLKRGRGQAAAHGFTSHRNTSVLSVEQVSRNPLV